jgi:ATP-dependent Clp protease ATP-binding subunit ClpC
LTAPEFRPGDLERFDESARNVMELAREEGRLFQQDYVGTEHVLAGLLRAKDPIATEVLRSFGIEVDTVRTVLHTIIGSGLMPGPPPRGLLTRRTARVLDAARQEAAGQLVRPAHLLLALLEEGGGVAAQILTAIDVDLYDLRTKLLERLASGEE